DPDERWQSAHDIGLELKWISKSAGQARTGSVPPPSFEVSESSVRFEITFKGAPFGEPEGDVPCFPELSPDGRFIVFVARAAAGKNILWLRALSRIAVEPLAGTEGASFPFWSPDSRHVAFF